jgi:hypothetical protein
MRNPKQDDLMTDPLDQTVNVNFRMTERDRRAFKAWCAEQGLSLTEGFHEGVALLRGTRDRFGPEPAEVLLGTIDAADAFVIDKEREIRVERRGPEAWAVREMASVVNRDGTREPEPMPSSRDENFIARTRFPLAEALRVARARAEVRE